MSSLLDLKIKRDAAREIKPYKEISIPLADFGDIDTTTVEFFDAVFYFCLERFGINPAIVMLDISTVTAFIKNEAYV